MGKVIVFALCVLLGVSLCVYLCAFLGVHLGKSVLNFWTRLKNVSKILLAAWIIVIAAIILAAL